MSQGQKSERRPGLLAVYLAIGLAILPALLVMIYVERVLAIYVPVAAAALPLLAKTPPQAFWLRLAALVLLSLIVLLGMMSVGRLFIPSAVAMAVACINARRSNPGSEALREPPQA